MGGWEAYTEKMEKEGCYKAAILGHNGKAWAHTKGFKVHADEVSHIVDVLQGDSFEPFYSGVTVAGKPYAFIRGDFNFEDAYDLTWCIGRHKHVSIASRPLSYAAAPLSVADCRIFWQVLIQLTCFVAYFDSKARQAERGHHHRANRPSCRNRNLQRGVHLKQLWFGALEDVTNGAADDTTRILIVKLSLQTPRLESFQRSSRHLRRSTLRSSSLHQNSQSGGRPLRFLEGSAAQEAQYSC
mmetsp:Transcript_1332/g.4016  ORF Transcript_1332/g.4016 Transcript_1332/m.4016 type:complete len:241 (-) Transcript_1332:568-1290(-)